MILRFYLVLTYLALWRLLVFSIPLNLTPLLLFSFAVPSSEVIFALPEREARNSNKCINASNFTYVYIIIYVINFFFSLFLGTLLRRSSKVNSRCCLMCGRTALRCTNCSRTALIRFCRASYKSRIKYCRL